MVSIHTPIAISITFLLSLLLLLHHHSPPTPIFHNLHPSTSTTTTTNNNNNTNTTTPKIAFLFLINSPLHFSPLWELFFQHHHNLFNIYIHADPSSNIPSPGGIFSGRFIAGTPTHRASPSLISATRRLLATALLHDPSNSLFALVSQNCIPLHSFAFIYNTLFLNPLSYIEILDREPQLWSRYIARGKNVMLPEIPFSSFRIGSQFFILTRAHASLVVNDTRLWSKFRLPCLDLHTCYPEEHYFPTLLSMVDPDGCVPVTLTRVNWTGSVDGHPHTYGVGEVSDELIRRLRVFPTGNYSYLFARKFSPECLEPLMKMAGDVIFRE